MLQNPLRLKYSAPLIFGFIIVIWVIIINKNKKIIIHCSYWPRYTLSFFSRFYLSLMQSSVKLLYLFLKRLFDVPHAYPHIYSNILKSRIRDKLKKTFWLHLMKLPFSSHDLLKMFNFLCIKVKIIIVLNSN